MKMRYGRRFRDMEDILKQIKALAHKRGFIYALLLIIRRDQTVFPSEYGTMNSHDRLITEEIGLLLRYWVENNTDHWMVPDSLDELASMKHEAIQLMDDLHYSYLKPSDSSFAPATIPQSNDEAKSYLEKVFPLNRRIQEAVFYSGDSLYDFEYTDYLPEKYKYDLDWLKENKRFEPNEVIAIVQTIKRLITEKSNSIPGLDENTRMMLEHPSKDSEGDLLNDFIEYTPFFTQELFDPDNSKRHSAMVIFCEKILNIFSISANDIAGLHGSSEYLNNFSLDLCAPYDEEYMGPGYFNILQTKPLLKYGDDKYLVPLVYWLFMSAYEVPYYWLMADPDYEKIAGSHRGQASEEIAFNILSPLFGSNLYQDIIIKGVAKKPKTDIDLLAVVGSVAICFQIKSKKLTESSKQGNIDSIRSDFNKAVMAAHEQGLICRENILNPAGANFYNKEGNTPFVLPNGIKDVYIVCLTSENYPALTSQVLELAGDTDDSVQSPIAFSIFDLRLITYYLDTPFDFAYYIRQRINTARYCIATTEMSLLGYHLRKKLWIYPGQDRLFIDDSFASDIDQNYYPKFANLKVAPDTVDRIANRWRNDAFEQLWKAVASHSDPRRTTVVFDLFDLSSDSVDKMMSMIQEGHERVMKRRNRVAVSMVFDLPSPFGITFLIQPPSFGTALIMDMEATGAVQKYQFHQDKWITLGRRIDSPYLVDLLMVDENPWQYNESMENAVLEYKRTTAEYAKSTSREIGRNDPCPCGSGKKYKNCHGK